jgi:hypothetical protein
MNNSLESQLKLQLSKLKEGQQEIDKTVSRAIRSMCFLLIGGAFAVVFLYFAAFGMFEYGRSFVVFSLVFITALILSFIFNILFLDDLVEKKTSKFALFQKEEALNQTKKGLSLLKDVVDEEQTKGFLKEVAEVGAKARPTAEELGYIMQETCEMIYLYLATEEVNASGAKVEGSNHE